MQHVQHAGLLQPHNSLSRPPAHHSLSLLRAQPHTACTSGVVVAAAAAATSRHPQHRSSSAATAVVAHAQAGEGPTAAGADDSAQQQQQPRRVRRLFRGSSSSSAGPSAADVSSNDSSARGSSSSSSPSAPPPPPPPLPPGRQQQPPAAVSAAPGRASNPPPARRPPPPPSPPADFLEDFAAAFESRAVAPNSKARQQPGSSGSNRSRSRSSSDYDDDYGGGEDLGYLSRDPALNSSSSSSSYDRRQSPYNARGGDGRSRNSSGGGGRAQLFGRPGSGSSSGSGGGSSYGKLLNQSGPGWGGRGKAQKGEKQQGMTLEDFDDIDVDSLSPAKQELLAKLRAEADEAERRRLLRKARSEAIPTKPKPRQDPVIFQAMTREWDEKMSLEEKRGARAAARQTARVGIYDRNRAMKAIRRKVVQAVKTKPDDQLTEEDRIIAQRAIEIREAAAAKSIQPTKEELAQEAMGVPRSYARAEALPEGMWEELKNKYRSEVVTIKLGRRGAAPQLATAIQNAWRSTEVVKLRIHDDKSSRKMNLPRMNLLLRELEEGTGGVLLDATGSSIWLFRGVDWSPPPPPPVYKPPPPEALLQQQYSPKGTWVELGGVTCYVVSSSSSSSSSGDAAGSSSSSSSSGVAAGPGDAMTVLMLPDHFSLDDSRAFLQVADKIASSGALVVLADVLGAPPDHPNSNTARQGGALAKDRGTNYWPAHRWPLVKKRKLEYMAFYQSGPGSWVQQRPKLLQLLEAMQQQGMYDPTGTAAAAGADAGAAASSSGDQQQADTATSTASSSSSSSRPLALWGTGWGSFIGLQAAGDEAVVKSAGVRAMVAISPATYNKDFDIAQKLQVPVALLPAKYDTMDQVMMFINLLAKPWELRCIFKRYGKVKPGWASWLPQWSDERAMRQIAEQQLTAVSWLKRELLGVSDGYELPEPQLPATAGSALSQAQLDAAAKQEADAAAAELAEAAADAE